MTDTKCFAHDHLTVAEYGLWDLCRELSHKTDVLYFDGRNMAKRFRCGGKDAMYKRMHDLIKSGWFVVLEPSKRKTNGQWTAHKLRVLSHEAWAEAHPKQCKTKTEKKKAPVCFPDSACLESDHQPVSKEGHSTGIVLQSDEILQTGDKLVKSTCPQFQNGIRALAEVLTSPKKSQTEAAVEQVCAASPSNQTGPVLQTRQDGSDCLVPEKPPVSPPVPKPKRRTMPELTKLAGMTHTTVEALLAEGKFELAT